jgi:hypothetical protein
MFSLMCTKLSVLLFYKRLVKGTYSVQFKWAVWMGMVFAVVGTIVPWVLLMTSCKPFEAIWMQWDLTYVYTNAYKFHCRKIAVMVAVGRLCGILSVLTDFYSLLLPTILLFRLQMSRRQRWALMCIFGVGYAYVCAIRPDRLLRAIVLSPLAVLGPTTSRKPKSRLRTRAGSCLPSGFQASPNATLLLYARVRHP